MAQMAQALDYEIVVCDPRPEYGPGWDVPGTQLVTTMPDDTVLAMEFAEMTAIKNGVVVSLRDAGPATMSSTAVCSTE